MTDHLLSLLAWQCIEPLSSEGQAARVKRWEAIGDGMAHTYGFIFGPGDQPFDGHPGITIGGWSQWEPQEDCDDELAGHLQLLEWPAEHAVLVPLSAAADLTRFSITGPLLRGKRGII